MKNKHDIESEVRVILIDKLGSDNDSITPETTLEDLGADSLDSVEIVMELEKNFNLQIPDAEGEQLKSLQQIVDYLDDKLNNQTQQ